MGKQSSCKFPCPSLFSLLWKCRSGLSSLFPFNDLWSFLLKSVYWFQTFALSQLTCPKWLGRWFTLVLGQHEFLKAAMLIYKIKLFSCCWVYRHRFLFLIVTLEGIMPFIFYFLWRAAAIHTMTLYDVGCLAIFLWDSFKILLLAVKAS